MDIRNAVNSAAGKVGTFTKVAIKKTGEAAETAKLKLALITEKRKLEKMFSTLGKLFYEQVKGTDLRIQIKAQMLEIDEQKAVIASIRSEIVASKGKAECAFCKKPLDMDATYCQNCGKQQFVKKCGISNGQCEGETGSAAPLSADEFVDTFKDTTDKYFG